MNPIVLPSGSRLQICYVATCRFECGVVMDMQFPVVALSVISLEVIVVVGGLQATSKTDFLICMCVKWPVFLLQQVMLV